MHSMYAGIRNGSQAFLSNGGPASVLIDPKKIEIDGNNVQMDGSRASFGWNTIQDIFKPKLIGLTAPARAGKDTVGGILHTHFAAARVAFANPLRAALRAMIPGLTDEHFFGNLKEVEIPWLGKSPRQMMQTLGTEWGRNLVHNELWLKIAEQTIDAHMNNLLHVAVTDVRFENEAHFIRQKGGQVWHIQRGEAPKVNAHASEAGVQFMQGDLIIDNNGTIADLEAKVWDAFAG